MPVNSGGGAVPAVRSGEQRSGAVLPVVRRGARARGRDDREVRKPVTVIFCDLIGSTALGEGRTPSRSAGHPRYFEAVAGTIRSFGGTVEKFIGDAVMAVFGTPGCARTTRSARRAGGGPRSASTLSAAQRRAGAAHRPSALEVRIGVNSGEVVAGEVAPRPDLHGHRRHRQRGRAACQRHAGPGEIVLGAETHRPQPRTRSGSSRSATWRSRAAGARSPRTACSRLPGWVGLAAAAAAGAAGRPGPPSAPAPCGPPWSAAPRDRSCQLFTPARPARRRQVAARGRGAPAAWATVRVCWSSPCVRLRRRGLTLRPVVELRQAGAAARGRGTRRTRSGPAWRRCSTPSRRRVDREPSARGARHHRRARDGRGVVLGGASAVRGARPRAPRSSSCSTTSTQADPSARST